MERGMYSEAEKELVLAEQADGKTRAIELLLAQVFIMKGQLDEARRILEKLNAADPENQTVGELMEAIGKQAESDKLDVGVITVQERLSIEKVADLKDGMHYLKSLPGVLGAFVVGDDGVVLEGKLNPKFEKELIQSGLEDNSKYNTQLSYQYTNAGMGGGLNWNRTHDVSTNEGGNYWW